MGCYFAGVSVNSAQCVIRWAPAFELPRTRPEVSLEVLETPTRHCCGLEGSLHARLDNHADVFIPTPVRSGRWHVIGESHHLHSRGVISVEIHVACQKWSWSLLPSFRQGPISMCRREGAL